MLRMRIIICRDEVTKVDRTTNVGAKTFLEYRLFKFLTWHKGRCTKYSGFTAQTF